MRTLTLDLLRHGETTAHGIYQGVTDVALSAVGREQMAAALEQSAGWQEIGYSPLLRCADAATLAANRLGLLSREIGWLREFDFGDWDGRAFSEVYSEQPERVEAFWADPAKTSPPGGETIDQLRQRVTEGRDGLLSGDHQHVLWVTHGGVIRALIADCLLLEPANWSRIKLEHAHFTRLKFYFDQDQVWPELVTCNVAQLSPQES